MNPFMFTADRTTTHLKIATVGLAAALLIVGVRLFL